MIAVNDDDIRRAVSRNAFDAGMLYELEGRVQEVRTSPDGGSIKALVQGSGRALYRLTISLNRARAGGLAVRRLVHVPRRLQLQARRRRPVRLSGRVPRGRRRSWKRCRRHNRGCSAASVSGDEPVLPGPPARRLRSARPNRSKSALTCDHHMAERCRERPGSRSRGLPAVHPQAAALCAAGRSIRG